jgi:arylamine N-acetyltransferase
MILDPDKHIDSVRAFDDFFGISPRKPELDSLGEILTCFTKIPYENISKIIKVNRYRNDTESRIRLPEEVIEQHISFHLGGTCFSLTFYLQSILTQHGFFSYPVMADMKAGRNVHCCLVAVIDGVKYLVDPGYLLTQPMELNPAKPKYYRTEFSGVEVRRTAPRTFDLFTFDKHGAKWRYRFRDEPVSPEDFLCHWQKSFNWNSMNYFCLTKVTQDGMLYLRRDFMRETTFSGKKNFNVKRTLHAAIQENFGIDKQIVEQAEVALNENLRRGGGPDTPDRDEKL